MPLNGCQINTKSSWLYLLLVESLPDNHRPAAPLSGTENISDSISLCKVITSATRRKIGSSHLLRYYRCMSCDWATVSSARDICKQRQSKTECLTPKRDSSHCINQWWGRGDIGWCRITRFCLCVAIAAACHWQTLSHQVVSSTPTYHIKV